MSRNGNQAWDEFSRGDRKRCGKRGMPPPDRDFWEKRDEKMTQRRWKSGNPAGQMRGATLLEALVSILILGLGILAIAGLQARSYGNAGDVQYRAEAIHMVNAYAGKMWAMVPPAGKGEVDALFKSGGSEFALFKREVMARLPGADEPKIDIRTDASLPTETKLIDIIVTWQPPGEKEQHRYTQTTVIGRNASP